MRRIVLVLIWTILWGFAAASHGQDEVVPDLPEAPDGESQSVRALSAEVDVETTLLEEALERYRVLAGRRDRALARLTEAYAGLDRALDERSSSRLPAIDVLLAQIDEAEGERARLLASERTLIESVLLHVRRLELLEQQLVQLRGSAGEELGMLGGDWDVVLLPLDMRGTFQLRQHGTLVSGTYRLAGGWDGSLQGTLVAQKVYLVRIDSKLGRSMELEGFVSADGKTIRGTWVSYELAGGKGGTGHWSATRR